VVSSRKLTTKWGRAKIKIAWFRFIEMFDSTQMVVLRVILGRHPVELVQAPYIVNMPYSFVRRLWLIRKGTSNLYGHKINSQMLKLK
jgi:hypothetical protein